MLPRSFSRTEIEQIVILIRLHLYNRNFFYGPHAIQKQMKRESVFPLPSISTIKRILSRNCLTHRRTGYYPEDYETTGRTATCGRSSGPRRSIDRKSA